MDATVAIIFIIVIVAAISFYRVTGRISVSLPARRILLTLWATVVAGLIYLIGSSDVSENRTTTIVFSVLVMLTIGFDVSQLIMLRFAKNWGFILKIIVTAGMSVIVGGVLIITVAIIEAIIR